jgi:hypothetical protein
VPSVCSAGRLYGIRLLTVDCKSRFMSFKNPDDTVHMYNSTPARADDAAAPPFEGERDPCLFLD